MLQFLFLQNLLEFLEIAEDKFVKMGPLGADIEAVKKQIEQLKRFKSEVDPHMVKVEALNRSVLFFENRNNILAEKSFENHFFFL